MIAKGGPKLKEAEPANGPPPELPGAVPKDRDGFPILPAGRTNYRGASDNGVSRFTFRMNTTQGLLSVIQFAFGPSRTADKTGLTGKYDFTLEFSQAGLAGFGRGLAEPTDPAPDLLTALEKQLGLKLVKSKTQLDVIVVNHMDKEPTEN